jgi:hypothetical protein
VRRVRLALVVWVLLEALTVVAGVVYVEFKRRRAPRL